MNPSIGTGEFLLVQQGSEDVRLVVRTINSAAFTAHDWEEFVVTVSHPDAPPSPCALFIKSPKGPYHYSTKSKASYYWSRTWGATKRLQCQYWVFTDWQRWTFGCFDQDRKHGWVSGVMGYDSIEPSVLQALTYWSQYVDYSLFFKRIGTQLGDLGPQSVLKEGLTRGRRTCRIFRHCSRPTRREGSRYLDRNPRRLRTPRVSERRMRAM